MGKHIFLLPDIGEGIAEAEIVAWHVSPGDLVEEDQPLADLMTDKATVEITSPIAGKVLSIGGQLGARMAIGAPLVEFDVEGEGNGASVSSDQLDPTAVVPPPAEPVTPARAASAHPAQEPMTKPLASPAVRRRADDQGISLAHVVGTGPAGRILHHDLDDYRSNGRSPATAHRRTDFEQVRVLGLRRRIAEKMQEAKRRIPHFTYVEEIDVGELEDLRLHLNATRASDKPKLSILPLFIRALIRTLPAFPQLNATFDDEAGVITRHGAVHVGVATQTSGGLMVPVIRHAEALGLWGLAVEIARLAAAARDGTAAREELVGSTITVTSLGTLGGLMHTPVINHPEVGIVGPNRVFERPIVKDGRVVVARMMNLSSSFDHRVVDGADAAEFVQSLKRTLEHPATIFIE